MMGKTGNHVPEYCVPINHCGTHAPGWLNGTHPSVHEGIVTRQVCYHWKGKCCYWKNNIKIRNCGNYYVYHLVKPPTCLLRYCGDWRREWKGELLVCRYELSAGQETILETLRSNDADDNENVKKTIGLISKTTTSHVHHTFLNISFPFLHDYDVKMPNFAFY